MTTFDTELLPPADAAMRCAPHAVSIDLDPGGTALRVDELIVVDMPLPWPKPVWAKDGFTEVPELMMAAGETGRRIRVLAAVPLADGIGRVVTHRLVEQTRFERAEHQVDPSAVPELLAVLLRDGLAAQPETVVDRAPRPEFLLCTQGSHDVCCGSLGMDLLGRLALADPDLSVRRVSHTGGHRMAPTGVALPSGRMWGFVTVDETVAILRQTGSPADVAAKCRGWLGADAGPAQMAERAVLAQLDDWDVDARPRHVSIVDIGESDRSEAAVTAGTAKVVVRIGDDAFTVVVAPGRDVPTIACGQIGGLPAKPGKEWRVLSVEPRVSP